MIVRSNPVASNVEAFAWSLIAIARFTITRMTDKSSNAQKQATKGNNRSSVIIEA
jgi:hypothetical protein